MPLQILLNTTIAFIWMFLHDEWRFLTFTTGYLIGLLLIFALRRFFPTPFYLIKLYASIKLLLIFIKELIGSSILVIRQVTSPKLNITPGIVKMETDLRSDWELTTLSCLITLTPGSVVLEVLPEDGILYIHIMDIPEGQALVAQSKEKFERVIMEVMR